jgi:hypothetical protein
MRFTATLNYKHASDEASQDNCEAYLSFCESNDTLPRAPFTVNILLVTPQVECRIDFAEVSMFFTTTWLR